MHPDPSPPAAAPGPPRWQRFTAASLRGYHAYAHWLVRLSWWRFVVYALLLIFVVGIVQDMPPFTWTITEHVEVAPPRRSTAPHPPDDGSEAPSPDASSRDLPIRIDVPKEGARSVGIEIGIGKEGIRIAAPGELAASAASAGSPAEAAASVAADGLRITLPPGATSEAVREAVARARREIEAAMREPRLRTRITRVGIGDFMMQFALLWVLGSAILKYTYKGRMQAEREAAQATQTAEAESLRRQVAEARMAAMQAQVEPHFLFNTLASIDHLIETDPARASRMQKNLIALLRASMPTMREAAGNGAGSGVRDLGRELAVIRPYLEILQMRMEERLVTTIDVPDGLLSAEFPPMMIQTLVENAIKHGLEPRPEGGRLHVEAEIVHGRLEVTVADTGLGFGQGGTAGSGVGLANIRERLRLLYGARASLTVAANEPSGTRVTIAVPYRTVRESAA